MADTGKIIALAKAVTSDLKREINVLKPEASASDVGKALIVKTVADGVPTSYEYGQASVDPEDIVEAVDDWLEENFTNPDSPPLDRSLSSSSSAAPADMVGDLKNAFESLEERGGFNMTISNLLHTILSEALFGTDQSVNIELLYKATSNIAPISISAVLSDEVTPYVYTPYSDLKFIVTATFDDYSTLVVPSYTVEDGTVSSGSNTATIHFRGVTTTVTFQADPTPVYEISYELNGVSSSNDTHSVIQNDLYSTDLTPTVPEHFIDECTVTMGGTDITSTAYSNGHIIIEEVTGNVVITAIAAAYVYLPDLIRKRSGFDTVAYFSPDNHTSQAERIRVNNNHVGLISEYPTKTDTTLTWTITNTGESSISISGLGFAQLSMNDSTFVAENEYAYFERITNVGNTLQAGESLSGTYLWRAGYQLVCTVSRDNIDYLEVKLRGAYNPETFTDYEDVITFDGAITSVSKTYGTFTYYLDNGVTVLGSGKDSKYFRITDNLTAGEYDIVYRYVNKHIDLYNNNRDSIMMAAFAEPIGSQTSVNYAVGYVGEANKSKYITQTNIWCYGTLIVSSNGMSLITSTNDQLANDGITNGYGYFELRMKEAEE